MMSSAPSPSEYAPVCIFEFGEHGWRKSNLSPLFAVICLEYTLELNFLPILR